MANLFVVSKMKNAAERKAVIDRIHTLGHEPAFIESQQMRQGKSATKLMDIMTDRADGLLIILDDDQDLGKPDPNLKGYTPIEYEVRRFIQNNPNWLRDKSVHVFGRRYRQYWSGCVQHVVAILGTETEDVVPFRYYDDLAVSAHDKITEVWGRAEPVERSALHLHIHWAGKDKPGRLGALAGFLFTEFGLNITHLSGVGVAHRGSIILTGTTASLPRPTIDEIKSAIEEQLRIDVKVDEIGQEGFPSQFYFELRVLDVPGVLNALCKALGDDISIDDIRQRPTFAEHERQAEILIWLSAIEPADVDDLERKYIGLESRLRNLVGVRALSSRRLRPIANASSIDSSKNENRVAQ